MSQVEANEMSPWIPHSQNKTHTFRVGQPHSLLYVRGGSADKTGWGPTKVCRQELETTSAVRRETQQQTRLLRSNL